MIRRQLREVMYENFYKTHILIYVKQVSRALTNSVYPGNPLYYYINRM